MNRSDIARQRLRNARLVGAPFARPEDVVGWLGAVQAQDYAGAKWALAQRTKQCLDAAVEDAVRSGRILRTHVLRPTWHFVLPDDIRWMLELTAPRVTALMAYYARKHALDPKTFRRSNALLAKALAGGAYLTREELGRTLDQTGIRAQGERLGLLMMHAELDAVICSGPRRGKQFTYALLDERVPAAKPLKRDEALAELTRRYFTSHGPALFQDFAWWSGLTVADARAGVEMVEPRLAREQIDGKTYWFAHAKPAAKPKHPSMHLLPNYDEYLIAYKDYGPVFDRAPVTSAGRRERILDNHIVVRNGLVVGGWRRTIEKDGVRVEVVLIRRFTKADRNALKAAADRYGKSLGLPVRLVVE